MSAAPRVAIIIPARMASTRFPSKPLVPILGLPMIEHVRRRLALHRDLAGVYVATCDDEIRRAVEGYGGTVIMTSPRHERATDRVEEAAAHTDCDVVVNVQGDEPTVLPDVVDLATRPLLTAGTADCSCLVYPIEDPAEMDNANVVKVVMAQSGSILYFSRAPIPSRARGVSGPRYKQSGIMAFRKMFLHQYARLTPTPLEATESVDMLRVLEHGFAIAAVVTTQATYGVDVPSDVGRIERVILEDPAQRALHERITAG